MDTAAFLARTVAPGNYIAIGYNHGHGTPLTGIRMFPEGEFAHAAGYAQALDQKGEKDVYHAQASFTTAAIVRTDKRGEPVFVGNRVAGNVHHIRSFFIDFDVKREGDKKKPDVVYPSRAAALTWLKQFLTATALPLPNQIVNSGYGLHAYWILEDAMRGAEWQPYADALKHLMLTHGFTGDTGITGDIVRWLRPVGTRNHKVAGNPVPVEMVERTVRGELPNELVLGVLRPHINAQAQARPRAAQAAGQGASGLAGSNVSSIFAGVQAPNMAAAAQAALPASARRERSFARIAQECEQTKLSLAQGGLDDSRKLWMLGHLTTAHFCVDGADFVHKIGEKDPDYTPAETDAKVAEIARTQTSRGFGFPTCQFYERERPGVCSGCKHFGKVRYPLDLGLADGDLPEGYRRANGALQRWVKASSKEGFWENLVDGDVYGPMLDRLHDGSHAVTFTYELAGDIFPVRAADTAMLEPTKAGQLLSKSSITLSRHNAGDFGDFIVAWISQLRAKRLTRLEQVQPFGWTTGADGKLTGFSVGGTHYRSDGSSEAAPGGDKVLLAQHQPQGDLVSWRQAADFVMKDRPDLQAIVAASFAAPLMRLTGIPGVVMSVWSVGSGVGKTSALTVAQGVWGDSSARNGLTDTNNSVFHKAAALRALPIFYDEARFSDNGEKFNDIVFQLAEGKEKARMGSDISLRPVGTWETVLVTAGNRPLADFVAAQNEATPAGRLRLFEFQIDRAPAPQNPVASTTVALAKDNYGHAGRLYAAYLAANHEKLRAALKLILEKLVADLGATDNERFYTAGMATMLLGARVATKLGLAIFDHIELNKFLRDVFYKLRQTREGVAVANQRTLDVEQILGVYMSEMLGRKIITNRFLTQGHKAKDIKLLWNPQSVQSIDIHIGQEDKMMRINRVAFRDWCRKKTYPPEQVIETMVTKWGATIGKRVIGGGTSIGGGQIYCIDIPLASPELETYLDLEPAGATGQTPKRPKKDAPHEH